MTLGEFKIKYLGVKLDFDSAFGEQCVDVTKAYAQECLGIGPLMGNAIDYKDNPWPQWFDLHINTLTYIPGAGSIAVWNDSVGGGFGHVGIVDTASLMFFHSFDQNWPKGSSCHIQLHSYTNVVCFLVPKVDNASTQLRGLLAEIKEIHDRYYKNN